MGFVFSFILSNMGASSSSRVEPREKTRVLNILASKQARNAGRGDLSELRNVDCFYRVKGRKTSWKVYFVLLSNGRLMRYEAHPQNWGMHFPRSERKKRVKEDQFIARYLELEKVHLKAAVDVFRNPAKNLQKSQTMPLPAALTTAQKSKLLKGRR